MVKCASGPGVSSRERGNDICHNFTAPLPTSNVLIYHRLSSIRIPLTTHCPDKAEGFQNLRGP